MPKMKDEKKKKREIEEAEDYLKQVESGGRKFVVEDIEKDQKAQRKATEDFLSGLETKKLYKITYRRKLADELQKKLEEIDFPKGWKYNAIPTDGKTPLRVYGRGFDTKEGIVLVLKSSKGEVFIRAVSTCYQPEVDFKAMNILAVQAENTVDSAKGILLSDKDKKTKSGIYLP